MGGCQGQPGQISSEAAAHPSRSAVTYKIILHVWKPEGRLTGLVVTIGEGCGDQRSLQHKEKHAYIQGFCSPIIKNQARPRRWGQLTPKLWLKPVLGAGLAALR